MTEEQQVQDQLVAAFDFLKDKVTVARPRRMFAEVSVVNFPAVFDHVVRKMGFTILCTITGLDEGSTLGVMYHMARIDGVVLTLVTAVHKIGPVLTSVTSYFPAAEVYEREIVDLLGVEVRELPPGHRYPLPDDWPAGVFPLRKDWNLKMLMRKEANNEQK